jgi:tetratricopeptide (TPR) repeat protein
VANNWLNNFLILSVTGTHGESDTGARLDGWKRIAAYLNRDVRTLRRWEKSEGIPIRRLMHNKLASVYAYQAELDEWLKNRDIRSETTTSGHSALRGIKGQSWVWAVATLLVLVLLSIWYSMPGKKPSIAMNEWEWVLITEFDNRTGEELLDKTVEYALQRELSNSRLVKVVPRERINDALQLMKLPKDTPIDVDTGREISMRDGGILMLVTGSVEKLGNTYLISTELVNPSDGVMLASFSSEANGQDQVIPHIGKLASEVRATLGESMVSIEFNEENLERVTTPSLQALRLFTIANRIMSSDDRARALAILEEVVRIDPDFASAHLLLWYANNDRGETSRAEQHLRRAVELADKASERERLFILATYYDYLADTVKSIETYQLLLRLYPDHYWANGNLSNRYESIGRFPESLEFRKRVAELRPNSVGWYPDLDIIQLSIVNGDLDTLDFYVKKLKSYASDPAFGWLVPFMQLMPVHQAWVNEDYTSAFEALEDFVAGMDEQTMVADGWLFAHIRSSYLALGKLARFRQLSALRPQIGWFEAVLDYDSGNPKTLDRYLESAQTEFWDATLMALAGSLEGAQSIIQDPRAAERVRPYSAVPSWKSLVRGQIALSEKRPDKVVTELGSHSFLLNITAKWAYLFSMHSLAQAYDDLGNIDKAIEVLESARLQKPLTIFETGGAYMWQRNQLFLHALYKRAGRLSLAAQIREELRETLRLADPNHPFLLALGDL